MFSLPLPFRSQEFEGGFQGAVTRTEPAEQQPPSTAGLHVPPSGVRHQHSVLQPLDWSTVNLRVCNS